MVVLAQEVDLGPVAGRMHASHALHHTSTPNPSHCTPELFRSRCCRFCHVPTSSLMVPSSSTRTHQIVAGRIVAVLPPASAQPPDGPPSVQFALAPVGHT